jgi:hypothetical protein
VAPGAPRTAGPGAARSRVGGVRQGGGRDSCEGHAPCTHKCIHRRTHTPPPPTPADLSPRTPRPRSSSHPKAVRGYRMAHKDCCLLSRSGKERNSSQCSPNVTLPLHKGLFAKVLGVLYTRDSWTLLLAPSGRNSE